VLIMLLGMKLVLYGAGMRIGLKILVLFSNKLQGGQND
jgi:hypothetical protein